MKIASKFFETAILGIFGVVALLFPITALILHLWTSYIAYTESGFFAAVVSMFLPVLSEFYWMIKMFGENNLYAWMVLIHVILAIPFSLGRR